MRALFTNHFVKMTVMIFTYGMNTKTKLTLKLDFPGKLCRAAFAILVMFVYGLVWITCSTWEEREQLRN